MKTFMAVLFIFSFLIFSTLALAQTCLTGADADCDGNVSLTELMDYIDLWYGCSSCYPDLFQAIEAYYEICIPESLNVTCGNWMCGNKTNNCGDEVICGDCDVLYPGEDRYCQNGQCIEISGNVYYVDAVNGNDTWDGNSTHPWRTISKAKTSSTWGDTVKFRDGNYGEFKYQGNNDWPHYTGPQWQPLDNPTYWYWIADDGHSPYFEVIFMGNTNYDYEIPIVFDGIDTKAVSLRRVYGSRFKNMKMEGSTTSSGTRFDMGTGGACCDIGIENCEMLTSRDGIKLRAKHAYIHNCTIHNIGEHMIKFWGQCQYIDIRNNSLYDNHDLPGEEFHCDAFFIGGTNSDVVIASNKMWDLGSQGIFTNDQSGDFTTNLLIENNLIYDCWSSEFQFYNTENLTVRNNTIIGHPNPSAVGRLYFRTGNTDGTINCYNNIIIGEYSATIADMNYHDYNIVAAVSTLGSGESNSYVYGESRPWPVSMLELFVNASSDDYRLKADSPACNKTLFPGGPPGALPCVGEISECTIPNNCPDIECNTKDCVDNQCVYTPTNEGISCTDDGLFCTGTETCQSGSCVSSGNPCTDDGYSCTKLCDEASKSCNVPDNSLCDDSDICTDDTCIGSGGDANGCSYSFNTNPCDDEIDCTESDVCSLGICSGTPNDDLCRDANCTDSICHADTGCEYLPVGCKVEEVPEGYISWWKFDEISGTTASDSGPGNNDGTLNNMDDSDWVSGKSGNALDFDGIDDYVDCGDDSSLAIWNKNFTFAAWAKLHSKGGDMSIIAKHPATGGYGIEFRYDVDEDYWELSMYNGGWQHAKYSQDNPNLNEWYHVAGVRDGSSIKIYVNGVVGATTDTVGTLWDTSGLDMMIGCEGADTDDRNFNGMIDEVMIYNRSLSETEIQQIYDVQK